MRKHLFGFGLAAALATISSPTLATPVNLTNWQALGDSLVTSGTATLTTAFDEGTPPRGTALDINALEPQLLVTPGTLGFDAYEGSALMQSFTFLGSTNLSFNWILGTENFDPNYSDLAFVLVNGTLVSLANAASTELSGLFSYTFGAGSHTLAFGVVDIGDYIGLSTLTVSGVDVSALAIPEPGSLGLLLAGLGILAVRSGNRRR